MVKIAEIFELPITAPSGASRFSGHSFRVTGAMFLASVGVDVWRIQLHGRWGSAAILRYVRLAPLAGNIAAEAALKNDLHRVRAALLSAKSELAQLTHGAEGEIGEAKLGGALGPELFERQGPLGAPTVSDLLDGDAAAKTSPERKPFRCEVLARQAVSGLHHALRPPCHAGTSLDVIRSRVLSSHNPAAWCGWKVTQENATFIVFKAGLEGVDLCRRCFSQARGQASSTHDSSSD